MQVFMRGKGIIPGEAERKIFFVQSTQRKIFQSNKVRIIRLCSGYLISHMSANTGFENSSHQSTGMAALYISVCA
jgi:hypothetical protein